MATGGWNQDDLEKALALIKDHHASFREASQAYGIPKSTLHDHYSGKSNRSKCCPTPYLTECEEQELVDWAVEMGRIGYGRTREQVSMMVKKLLDKDGRQNPFVDNRPGKDWWYAFLRRHPELAMRTPEHLQLARAAACSEDVLSRWYTAFKQFLELNDVDDPARIWNADETGCLPSLSQIWQSSRIGWNKRCLPSCLRYKRTDHNSVCNFCCRDSDTTHSRVVSVALTLANLKRVG